MDTDAIWAVGSALHLACGSEPPVVLLDWRLADRAGATATAPPPAPSSSRSGADDDDDDDAVSGSHHLARMATMWVGTTGCHTPLHYDTYGDDPTSM